MNTEEYKILNCIKQWLDIKNEYSPGITTSADVDHSALLRRLLDGKKPLPEPPPNGRYNEVEGSAPDHGWYPILINGAWECEWCSKGHRWRTDKEVHPKCATCGCEGHLSCIKCSNCGYIHPKIKNKDSL